MELTTYDHGIQIIMLGRPICLSVAIDAVGLLVYIQGSLHAEEIGWQINGRQKRLNRKRILLEVRNQIFKAYLLHT